MSEHVFDNFDRADDTQILSAEELRRRSATGSDASERFSVVSDSLTGREISQYQLRERIGSGGVGEVYRARHRWMKRDVAIKVLQSKVINKTLLDRFLREARSQAQLSHPGFVSIHDVFIAEGTYFLVMEYVDGYDLAEVSERLGPLDVEDVLKLGVQIAQAMAFAHSIGIIHRDLKPANLMLSRTGRVRVTDLGLAKCESAVAGSSPALTSHGTALGTVDFLAPEQARDASSVTAAADIYSLGCTLYLLLTASPPFVRETAMERLLAHQSEAPPSLLQVRPDLPLALASLIERMLAKRPSARSKSMCDVVRVLCACVASPRSDSDERLRQLVIHCDQYQNVVHDESRRDTRIGESTDAISVKPAMNCGPSPAEFEALEQYALEWQKKELERRLANPTGWLQGLVQSTLRTVLGRRK